MTTYLKYDKLKSTKEDPKMATDTDTDIDTNNDTDTDTDSETSFMFSSNRDWEEDEEDESCEYTEEEIKEQEEKWNKCYPKIQTILQHMDGANNIMRWTLNYSGEKSWEDVLSNMRGFQCRLNDQVCRELPKNKVDYLNDGVWVANAFLHNYGEKPYDSKYFDDFKYMKDHSNKFNKKSREHMIKTFKLIKEIRKYLKQNKIYIEYNFDPLFESISTFRRLVKL